MVLSNADQPYPNTWYTDQARLGAELQPNRLFRWSGAPPVAQLCGSGQDADGVTSDQWPSWNDPTVTGGKGVGLYACSGRPVRVVAGAAFAAGANLQSDAFGRVIQHASGPVIMRALEASSGIGSLVWAVFSR